MPSNQTPHTVLVPASTSLSFFTSDTREFDKDYNNEKEHYSLGSVSSHNFLTQLASGNQYPQIRSRLNPTKTCPSSAHICISPIGITLYLEPDTHFRVYPL